MTKEKEIDIKEEQKKNSNISPELLAKDKEKNKTKLSKSEKSRNLIDNLPEPLRTWIKAKR